MLVGSFQGEFDIVILGGLRKLLVLQMMGCDSLSHSSLKTRDRKERTNVACGIVIPESVYWPVDGLRM